jgi:hypothetical protein
METRTIIAIFLVILGILGIILFCLKIKSSHRLPPSTTPVIETPNLEIEATSTIPEETKEEGVEGQKALEELEKLNK